MEEVAEKGVLSSLKSLQTNEKSEMFFYSEITLQMKSTKWEYFTRQEGEILFSKKKKHEI